MWALRLWVCGGLLPNVYRPLTMPHLPPDHAFTPLSRPQVKFKPLSSLYKWFMGRPRSARRPVVSTTNPLDAPLALDLSSQLAASLTLAQPPDSATPDKATGVPDTEAPPPAHDASEGPQAASLRGASSLQPPSVAAGEREDEWVDVLVNNSPVPQLRMSVGPGGLCYFRECAGGRKDLPTSEALSHMPLQPGRNDIEFVYRWEESRHVIPRLSTCDLLAPLSLLAPSCL